MTLKMAILPLFSRVVLEVIKIGMQLSAYSWKLPAYSGAFLVTVVFGAFLITIGAFSLTIFAFWPSVEVCLLTVGKCV